MNSFGTEVDLDLEEEINEEQFSDFGEFIDDKEEQMRHVEDDIKSVTSFKLSPEESWSLNIDTRLKVTVPSRAYDAIVNRAQRNALKNYQANLSSELSILQKNHINVQKEYGTFKDSHSNDWEIDINISTDEEIQRSITRLRKKLASINNENEELINENQKDNERLHQIFVQNEKLERMKSAQ